MRGRAPCIPGAAAAGSRALRRSHASGPLRYEGAEFPSATAARNRCMAAPMTNNVKVMTFFGNPMTAFEYA